MQVGTRTRTGSTAAGDVRGAGQQGAIHRIRPIFLRCVECTSYFVRGVFVKPRTQSSVCPSSNISQLLVLVHALTVSIKGERDFWCASTRMGKPHFMWYSAPSNPAYCEWYSVLPPELAVPSRPLTLASKRIRRKHGYSRLLMESRGRGVAPAQKTTRRVSVVLAAAAVPAAVALICQCVLGVWSSDAP
jgi:hypothetical protein